MYSPHRAITPTAMCSRTRCMRSISLSEATPYLAHREEDNSRRTRARTFAPGRQGVLGCFGARGNATHSSDLEMTGGLRSVPNILENACILRRLALPKGCGSRECVARLGELHVRPVRRGVRKRHRAANLTHCQVPPLRRLNFPFPDPFFWKQSGPHRFLLAEPQECWAKPMLLVIVMFRCF
jgi:hypothetical protein